MKKKLIEGLVGLAACAARSWIKEGHLSKGPRIFVLRNNDIGDLLVITPLFEALRRRFPDAWIAAGVGSWNRQVLEHNLHLDQLIEVNGPWHNKVSPRRPHNSVRGFIDSLRYIAC